MEAAAAVRTEAPATADAAAALLRDASAADGHVRFRGGGTHASWGNVTPEPDLELSTAGLDELVEHNVGDLTAVVQAGVPLARLHQTFAAEGQMLALDPPLGADDAVTIGGVVATGDSGPLRHRFGAARDLVLGLTVALSDGTVARAGGKVIKNVAGYDLAKLFSGSFGTLGLIVQVSLRLTPLPQTTATGIAHSDDPRALAGAAATLASASLEPTCLDIGWAKGRGAVMARFAGATAAEQATAALALLDRFESEVTEDDAGVWSGQREHQRSADGVIVRVSGRPAELERVLRAAEHHGATVVGRAAQGLSWIGLAAGDPEAAVAAVADLRARLSPAPCTVLDAPAAVRTALDPWGEADALELMRRVKRRFDPAGACNPGVFVGGI
jgi:glycolate oxidase FAD binding subunit